MQLDRAVIRACMNFSGFLDALIILTTHDLAVKADLSVQKLKVC